MSARDEEPSIRGDPPRTGFFSLINQFASGHTELAAMTSASVEHDDWRAFGDLPRYISGPVAGEGNGARGKLPEAAG
jgi:hypothetical protein